MKKLIPFAVILAVFTAAAVYAGVTTGGSVYEVQALTTAAPTLATEGVPLAKGDGTVCTNMRLSIKGGVDAGTSNANDYLTGGIMNAWRYTPALGWTRDYANDITVTGDGGTGTTSAMTFAPKALSVTNNGARALYRASAVTVSTIDAGSAVKMLLECEYK